jgi:chaperonin cofactor prefoldin
MADTVEVKLARLEEKIDTVLRRLESGDRQFRDFEERMKKVEERMNLMWGGIIVASFVIQYGIRYFMGG